MQLQFNGSLDIAAERKTFPVLYFVIVTWIGKHKVYRKIFKCQSPGLSVLFDNHFDKLEDELHCN